MWHFVQYRANTGAMSFEKSVFEAVLLTGPRGVSSALAIPGDANNAANPRQIAKSFRRNCTANSSAENRAFVFASDRPAEQLPFVPIRFCCI
jgi:hypothetical protein